MSSERKGYDNLLIMRCGKLSDPIRSVIEDFFLFPCQRQNYNSNQQLLLFSTQRTMIRYMSSVKRSGRETEMKTEKKLDSCRTNVTV